MQWIVEIRITNGIDDLFRRWLVAETVGGAVPRGYEPIFAGDVAWRIPFILYLQFRVAKQMSLLVVEWWCMEPHTELRYEPIEPVEDRLVRLFQAEAWDDLTVIEG